MEYDNPTHWMHLPDPPTEAGTPALNAPPRSHAEAIAERALTEIAATRTISRARATACVALREIAELRKGEGR